MRSYAPFLFIIFCFNLVQAQDCIDESLIDPFAACTFDYNPVCGCNQITYTNSCFAEANGVTTWIGGECGADIPPCTDLGNVSFGLCDMALGVGLVNGFCTSVSGCSYVVNDVDYSAAFFSSFEDCLACDNSFCNDLSGLDFGECEMVLGIALVDNVCQEISGCSYFSNGVDYSNDFFSSMEACSSCPEACLDLGTVDFGLCDQFLGFAYLNGSCSPVSGCGYVVDEVDYSPFFFENQADCSVCANSDCTDLTGIDFGVCAMPLGIALIDNTCQFLSGCGYVVDDVDYSPFFYENLDDCLSCPDVCYDLGDVFFGPCDFFLGIGLVDGTCTSISGCDYLIGGVDYTNQFYSSVEDCENACLSCIDETIIGTLDCDSEYDPVCGCDGRTYWNACLAADISGVTSFESGPCSCFDPNIPTDEFACFDIYDPVCGCDNVTYGNSCYAFYLNGITEWVPGECPNQVDEFKLEQFKAYPNPFDEVLILERSVSGLVKIVLSDAQGRTVYSEVSNETKVHLDLRLLNAGLYLLNLTDLENGSQSTLRVIK